MTIRKIYQDYSSLKKIGLPEGVPEAPPAGIAPILKTSWKFARDMARRFNQELKNDRNRVPDLLKTLIKKFV